MDIQSNQHNPNNNPEFLVPVQDRVAEAANNGGHINFAIAPTPAEEIPATEDRNSLPSFKDKALKVGAIAAAAVAVGVWAGPAVFEKSDSQLKQERQDFINQSFNK